MRASFLPLVVAFVAVSALDAGAQPLPWPSNPPSGSAGSPAAMTPPSMSPAPPMGAAPPMMGGAPPMMGGGGPPPGMGGGGPGMGVGGNPPPCVVEFGKLRDEVQKKGTAAKYASEHKTPREEMCKMVVAYSSAEQRWLKFAETGITACGIPVEIVNQLKQVHARTEQAREKICAAGPANNAAAAAPSLADALGTTRLPYENKTTGANTFDTLTGNAIQK
jgi:hypothetical protein